MVRKKIRRKLKRSAHAQETAMDHLAWCASKIPMYPRYEKYLKALNKIGQMCAVLKEEILELRKKW